MTIMGKGEKNDNKLAKIRKIAVWLLSHPPICDMENRLFSGSQEDRKQTGSSLNRVCN